MSVTKRSFAVYDGFNTLGDIRKLHVMTITPLMTAVMPLVLAVRSELESDVLVRSILLTQEGTITFSDG